MNCRHSSTPPPRRTWGWLKAGLFGAALALFGTADAQLAMTRSSFTGAYAAITTGTGATTWSGAAGDDVTQSNVPIGFTFNYLGTPYTTVAICNSGWISFNAATISTSFSNGDMYSTSGPNLGLFPWFDDPNFTLNSISGAPTILYQTQGSAGSRTFTVQWQNVNAGRTAAGGTALNFQCILYETSNIIEFWYGPKVQGTNQTSCSASIGIEGATGGNGNYLDAMTGSSRCGHFYLGPNQWPARNFRFTPGAPSVLAGGSYNVGVGQTYPSLTEAVADVQQRGISGAITLNLTDAVYDTTAAGGNNMFPILLGPVTGSSASNTISINKTGGAATIRWGGNFTGETSGSMVNQASTAINGSNVESIIGLVGADYVTVNNVDIRGNVGFQNADHAIGVYNSSATDGSQFNTFTNFTTIMRRANTGSRGVVMNTVTTPTSAAGANSNNTFRDFSITNCYGGIVCTNSSTTQAFPDLATTINRTNCATFNTIGDPATANDIGNGTTATSGISLTGQSGFFCANNSVRNVTASGVVVNGIDVVNTLGIPYLNNNIVRGIRNSSTSSTTAASGIRMSCSTAAGTHRIYCYNNAISDINSAYTGVASATRTLKGIFVQTGGASPSYYDIYHNSVSINGSGSPNLSSVCFETGTSTGTIYNVKDNIFANFTPTQAGIARHYGVAHTSATTIGPAGTSITNNDIFIQNDVNVSGFTAVGNTTNYNGVAAWQGAITSPAGAVAANIEVDPVFADATADLHAGAAALNNGGVAPPGYYTTDLDCATRTPDNDIGAFIINSCSGATAGSITGGASGCFGIGNTLSLSGASTGLGISYQWKWSATPGGPYGNNLGTALSQSTSALAAGVYYIVADVTCSSGPVTATTAEFTFTMNALPTIGVTPPSGTLCYGGSPVALTASGASTYAWAPAGGLSATTGTSVTASPGATTTYTVTGTSAAGCVNTTTVTITVPAPFIVGAATATPNPTCFNGNASLNVSASTTTSYAVASTTYGLKAGTPTAVSLGDDNATGAIAMPFSFAYNGVVYSSLYIHSNGFVSFSAANTTGSPYLETIPNPLAPNNYIAICHDDLNVTGGGTVGTFTFGSAPNRVFVIDWLNVKFYNATANNGNMSGQIQLYEADAHIEIHVTSTDDPVASAHVIGLENAGGTAGASPAGRNNVTYNFTSATPEAWSFTPNGVGSFTYDWSANPNFLSATNVANPAVTGINTASELYSVNVSDGSCTYTRTVTLTTTPPITAATISGTLSFCTGGSTTLTAVPTDGAGPYTYLWAPGGETTAAISVTAGGTYSCQVTDNCGGSVNTGGVTVVQNALPTVAVAPTSSNYCTGTPAIALAASGADTYAWLPALGLDATNVANVNASPAATTTYTVTGTVTATGCVNTATSAITVLGAAPVIISTTSVSPVCPGSPSQLQVNLPAPSAYCNSAFTNVTYEFLTNVTFAGINNTSAGNTGGPVDYTAQVASVTAGSAYNLDVTMDPDASDYIYAWFDWNQNGVFTDLGEGFTVVANVGTAGPHTVSIPVPAGAINGNTRMRVMVDWNNAVPNPCRSATYGEAEDYTVNVSGGVSAYSYSWAPAGDLNNAAIANPIATILTENTSTTYTVTVTNGAGCTAQGTASVTTPLVNDGDPCTLDACASGVASHTFQDADSDGICDANDPCPNLANLVNGDPCNDGDVCTIGDVVAGCVCAGTFQDTDLDGVCDANDPCPTLANVVPGDPCTDGNVCTINDVYTALCVCAGTFQDTDNDGTCDANDPCPTVANVAPGDPCDDSNVCTINDVYTVSCVCAGTFQDTDADGLCDANDNCPNLAGVQGDACDDGNPNTTLDVITPGCVCAGQAVDCLGVPSGTDLPGTPCNDANVCTINDTWSVACVCVGTFQDTDLDGICDANDNCPTVPGVQGDACTDGNVCTIGDVLNASCVCVGTFQDTDSDGICDANDNCPTLAGQQGDACTDGDVCTINDVITGACVCAGTFQDTDNDGTCDANDPCPTVANVAPGDPCDDSNVCTINDVYTAGCVCAGTFQDTDNDGTCDANDPCPTLANIVPGDPCDDSNVCTINDVYTVACVCAGTFQDTDSDGICDANDNCPTFPGEQGDACDDGNVCTIGDVITAGCVCAGTIQDTDGDGVCDANDNCPTVPGVQGDACDDGDGLTTGDVLDANCVCTGSPCTQNSMALTFDTDNDGDQISWYLVEQTMTDTVCSGSGLPDNSNIIVGCCLADGCYDLIVTDMFGDGINPGGFVLRDGSGRRVIDNAGNGNTFSTVSKSPLGFCLPLSAEGLVPSSCDIENASLSTVLQATPNAVITAFYTPGNISQQGFYGYQYWVTNPHGGFSRRITLTLGAPGSGWPAGTAPALKPTYFALSTMNQSAPFIPRDVLLNVRVRAYINGVYGQFGPACRLMLPYPPCTTTQLTTTATPVISCGATGLALSSTIYADAVSGATHYQFEFSKPGYTRRIAQTVRSTALNFVTSPLQNNNCYQVRVRVSFDGLQTYCPFGPYCTVTIGTAVCAPPAMALEPTDDVLVIEDARLSVWPNPNDGSLVNVSLTEFDVTVNTVMVEVTDVYGKLVSTRTVAVQDGFLNTTMAFEQDLAPGLYLVNLQVGEKRFTERLMIQR